LLNWLNALDEKYALRVTQIDVSAGEKPGMVNVQRLEFRRGRCCHPCHSHPLNST
ncbi:TPA: type II secretion system protein M, partial [Escherichia coli]|nr:type II secretion system protein M [Escherichia coli]HDP6866482.1 type II secretion system protein M [Escherichia coli]